MYRSHLLWAALSVVLALATAPNSALGTGATLHKSGPIQITADGTYVWVVNPDHDSVSRIRTADGLVNEFPLPAIGETHKPIGLDILPDGSQVWVAAHDATQVHVLDASNGQLIESLNLHHGSGPISVAISSDGSLALVALHRAAQVAVFDTATRSLVKVIDVRFLRPFGISFTSNADEAWVTHTLTDGEDSYMTAIDTAGLVVKAAVKFGAVDPRHTSDISGDPVPNPIPEGGYLLFRKGMSCSARQGELRTWRRRHQPRSSSCVPHQPDSAPSTCYHAPEHPAALASGAGRAVL